MLAAKIVNDPFTFHSSLAKFNVDRIAVATPSSSWEEKLQEETKYRITEGRFLEEFRASIIPLTLGCQGNVNHFVSWFESLFEWGPGQHHSLFPWLADHASMEQMRWFLTQEAAGEAGFEDLIAYAQVKLPQQAKLECARNYWDEMGRGKPKAMHGPLLELMVEGLDLTPSIDTTTWESLALGNVMFGLATSRRYTYQALGALGVIELTAPFRAVHVARGMKRLNMPKKIRAYFDLHAVLDVLHSREWIKEIIRPLVVANPECALYIAEGALMRLKCGEQCFDRYSQEFGIDKRKFSTLTVPLEKRKSLEIVN